MAANQCEKASVKRDWSILLTSDEEGETIVQLTQHNTHTHARSSPLPPQLQFCCNHEALGVKWDSTGLEKQGFSGLQTEI